MEHLSMCRICLATDVRLCTIARNLQYMYETITAMTFKREDKRPLEACYICHARLRNCYRLRTICLRSEELLTQMQSSGVFVTQEVSRTNTFGVVSVLHLSLGHMLQDSSKTYNKEESLEVIPDTGFDQQYHKDIKMEPQEEYLAQIDDNIQCSHLEDPLDVMTRESDDIEADNEDIKLEIEDAIIEENKSNIASQFSQSADNICPKIGKDVLERMVLNDTRPVTGVHALKKHAETDSYLVTEPEKKYIVFDKLIPVNNTHETVYKEEATLHKHKDNNIMADYEVYKQTSKSNISSNKKYFRSKSYLKYHNRTNTGEKQFQCDMCHKCLNSKRNLTDHMYTHTGEKRFQCDVCKKRLSSKRSLIQHMYKHTNEKRLPCDVCNKCLSGKLCLIQHMYTHTGNKQFQCDVCNKCLKSKRNLTEHMNIHTSEKRFQCDVCNKCLSNKRSLIQHMYAHASEKQFQCDVCKKCLDSKYRLIQHKYTHTGNKQFQCDVCKKCLTSKRNLTEHMNRHSGKKRS